MKQETLLILVSKVVILLTPVLLNLEGICLGEVPTIKLTRSAAIEKALQRNIDLRMRALDSSMAKNQIKASESIYNPYVTASLEYSQTNVAGETYGTKTTSGSLAVSQKLPTGATVSVSGRTSPISSYADPLYDYTDWSSSIGVSLYQPLLKNAGKDATELGLQQNIFTHEASIENFRENVIQTVFSVISEYNGLYVLYQLLESRKSALNSAQQLFEEIQAKPKNSTRREVEISNTEYALSQRQTELIEAERQVSSKEANLRYLIGMEDLVHIIPVDAPSRMEPGETEEEAIALAFENRPDLEELRIQLESNKLREKVSKRNLMPNLGVTASGGYRGYAEDGTFNDTVNQITDGKGSYWSAGMVLSYSLGNDLAESEYLRNKLLTEQLENRITAKEWDIRDMIREDNRSLISARQQIRTTAKSKRLAEQRVTEYRKNFRLGTSSVKDLIDAENDLIYARNLELKAVEIFAYRVARLWKDIGVLLDRLNIDVDTTHPEEVTLNLDDLSMPTSQTMISQTVLPAAQIDTNRNDISGESTQKDLGVMTKIVTIPQQKSTVAAENSADEAKRAPHKTTTSPLAAKNVSYTIQVGTFFSSEIEAAKRKIRQVGLVPVIMDSGKQSRQVYRLFIGQYPTHKTANRALQSLKNPQNGFVLKNRSGTYDVFAGSFFDRNRAEKEQRLLAADGLNLTLRQVSIDLPTYQIITGSFSSIEEAKKMGKKLEQQGLYINVLQSA